MPNQAKSLGMKLEKYQEGGVTKYKGVPLTDKEKAALKAEEKATKAGKETDAQAKQILKNAGLDVPVKPAATGTSPTDYELFKKDYNFLVGSGQPKAAAKMLDLNPAWTDKLFTELQDKEKSKVEEENAKAKAAKEAETPKPTAEELKKAAKSTPGPGISSNPGCRRCNQRVQREICRKDRAFRQAAHAKDRGLQNSEADDRSCGRGREGRES